ncbi:uncharacterized protein N7484_003233 [Penicillium longicatenatum]|uniref:uncharacterized protein n=1 Tax=Penicillium longicatenatum TaxID=1561947 RepID=UPI002546CB0A|nr:uncharacterized protein N7484_003233 [Penicillium longicatenatum]KAJ5649510.1 hypothetical protein N7484_003233 [Penicillium longicatenatum]
MLALASQYEQMFRGTPPSETSDTESPHLPSHGSSCLTSVTEISSVETSVEFDVDTSTQSEDKVEPPIIPYRFCLSCGNARSIILSFSGICVYCVEQRKYCIYGDHEEYRSGFVDKHGVEQVRCNNCRDDEESMDTDPKSSDGIEVTPEPRSDDQLWIDNEPQAYVEPQVDHSSLSNTNPDLSNEQDLFNEQDLSNESQIANEYQIGNNFHAEIEPELDIDYQIDNEPQDDINSQADNSSRAKVNPELKDSSQLGIGPQMDIASQFDDESRSDSGTSTHTEASFTAHMTQGNESEPANQVLEVKTEPMVSIDMNHVPQFLSFSIQGNGSLSSPIVIDPD